LKINSKILLIFFTSLILPFILFQNVSAQENIPSWVKTNAQWWHQGAIDDDTFLNAVSFLIDKSIIKISAVNPASSTSDESVPGWVKNVAGWWSQGAINEQEFLQAIEFLVNQNIIKIKNNINIKNLDLSNYNCDQNEDANGDGIPDLIDNLPRLSGMKNVEIVAGLGINGEPKHAENVAFGSLIPLSVPASLLVYPDIK